MSLRVWLPLNGDLTNNGLSDVVVTNNGATVDNTGKIGKCYTFSGSSQYLRADQQVITSEQYSISFWMYATNVTSNHCIFSTRRTQSGAVNIYLLTTGIRFDTGSHLWKTGFIPTVNTWYHIIAVQDATTQYLYVNGELFATQTGVTALSQVSSIMTIGCEHINGANIGLYFAGKLNDLRIYDHALSPKEVKLLSQGLVCHYKLSDPYLESTTNIVTTIDCLSATCYNGSRRKYGYGENTDMYKTMGFFEGKYCTKVYMGTSGELANPYPYINGNATVSDGTNAPEYKTVSFDYFGTIGTYIQPYKLGDGSATCTWTNKSASTQTGTYTNNGQIPVVPNKWNHITMVLHGTTAANAAWGYIILGAAHTSDTANYWLFANLQIEEKDHETPYAGVGGTRSENIVYDCSGYNNHAQTWHYDEYGAIVSTSDTTRNSIATYINSENVTTNTASGTWMIYGKCGLTTPSCLTIAFWCKPFQGYSGSVGNGQFCTTNNVIGLGAGTDYNTTAMHNRDGGIDFCSSTLIKKRIGITFTANEWHHYAVVYDGRYGRVYKDGVETGNVDLESTISLASFSALVIGYSHAGGAIRSNKSYYSDFRLYATALSQEDIQELYNTPVSVANTGAMLTQGEFVEVTT